ncbi:MAG: peroxiredoxin [Ignavibacteria bacterium]|nr:peroxiredoxin [Ignavibacteria bacterium]
MKLIIRLFMLLIMLSFLTFHACGGNAENLSVGNPAPDFTLQDGYVNNFTLSDYRGINPVIIYFYPKANTPGCTKQACGIRDAFSRFKENKIIVLGISVDSKESIKEFINDHNLNFPLLSDENKDVSKAYGVLNNIGLDSRITFIVDKNGNIASILRDVDVETHADDVYKIAFNLK